MDVFAVINHLLNFIAPALFVALLLALAGRAALGRAVLIGGFWRGLWRAFLVNAAVGIVVLAGGLVVFGNDGRMLTYAALTLASGCSQWMMSKGWRR
ncbi:MAG: hypothetical protein ABI589_04920 [Burkholderiales bacterium]